MEKQIMTQTERIMKVLESGNRFTAGQLAGLVNTTQPSVRARISDLRKEGNAVYSYTRKGDGKTFYRLGRPSRKMVAAAYAVFGSQAFAN
jgi:predicted ArsR family transcriptional regulator